MIVGSESFSIDANVILRYLLHDNEGFWAKADRIFRAIEQGKLDAHCDPVILAEVVWVMQSLYKIPRQKIAQGLGLIVRSSVIHVPQRDRYLRALRIYETSSAHFGDACACAAALEDCDGNLLSFDQKLSSVEGINRLEEPPGQSA